MSLWLLGRIWVAMTASAVAGGPFVEQDRTPPSGPPTIRTLPNTVRPASPRLQEDLPDRSTGPCFARQRLAGAYIAVLGAYEGRQLLSLEYENSQGNEVSAIRVGAEASGPPLLLVLTAFDPVIWDFKTFPSRRLRGVLVYGHQEQGVANLPRSVEVRFSTQQAVSSACGRPAMAYQGGRRLDELVERLESVLGRQPQSFHGAYAASGLHVERGVTAEPAGAIDPARIRASAPVRISAVPPRDEGLAFLVTEGAIRPATASDVHAYNEAATRRRRSGYLAPWRDEGLGTHRTYVVMRPITVPAGMFGGHSGAFIVMPGVPAPVDRGSHNRYYFLADATCRGVC